MTVPTVAPWQRPGESCTSADADAKQTARLGLGQPGVDGSQQPIVEVAGHLSFVG
jgi:hypothetical protein